MISIRSFSKLRITGRQFIFWGGHTALRVASVLMNANTPDLNAVMNSWYRDNRQDSEKWIARHTASNPDPVIFSEFELHARWRELANITGTPTVFINGVKLPAFFKIGDLKQIASLSWFNKNVEATS